MVITYIFCPTNKEIRVSRSGAQLDYIY